MTRKVESMGFVVDNRELRRNDVNLTAVTEYPCPRDVKCLQRFLGIIAFYRSLIAHFAELSRPLKQLLRKGVKWQWEAAEQQAFEALSRAIAETAALRIPHFNKPFVLQTDSTAYALCAVLLPEIEGVLRLAAFSSHTLNAAERNYMVTERECLENRVCTEKNHFSLDGASSMTQTDHMALT